MFSGEDEAFCRDPLKQSALNLTPAALSDKTDGEGKEDGNSRQKQGRSQQKKGREKVYL